MDIQEIKEITRLAMAEHGNKWPNIAAILDDHDALTAERDRLREALKPFSALAGELFASNYEDQDVIYAFNGESRFLLTFRDFRRARQALGEDHAQTSQEQGDN